MKKCEHIIELISLSIDGELSDTEKHQFEEHINSCIKCKEKNLTVRWKLLIYVKI